MRRTIGFLSEDKDISDHISTPVLKKGADMTILAKDMFYPARDTNINGNELIIGATGSGKTMSICEPRLLYTYNSSLIIPITKRRLFYLYAPLFKERGYDVWDLNLAHPEVSDIGYDPCKYMKTEDDILSFSATVTGISSRTLLGESDPYWSDATISTIASIIGLTKYQNLKRNKPLRFIDAIKKFKDLEIYLDGNRCQTGYDNEFREISHTDPSSGIPRLWQTLQGNSPKTASCIYSLTNNALNRFCGESGKALFDKKNILDIEALGDKKTAIFITTDQASEFCRKITNILYADIFKTLLSKGEREGGRLSIPVHILADDFACSSKINGFADYISIFRAAGISVTLLLQSLSQLDSLYGAYEGSTIRNNCDTWVFLGSMDLQTCKEMGERINEPLNKVMSMPIGSIIVSRRGMGSVMTERYNTLEDKNYKELIRKYSEKQNKNLKDFYCRTNAKAFVTQNESIKDFI